MVKKDEVREFLLKNPGAFKDEFKVSRITPTVRKTFEVEKDLVDAFMREVEKRGLLVKEAIDQALRAWLAKTK